MSGEWPWGEASIVPADHPNIGAAFVKRTVDGYQSSRAEDYQYGVNDGDVGVLKLAHGLSRQTVLDISRIKQEPHWMLDMRRHALDVIWSKPMPKWGLTSPN